MRRIATAACSVQLDTSEDYRLQAVISLEDRHMVQLTGLLSNYN